MPRRVWPRFSSVRGLSWPCADQGLSPHALLRERMSLAEVLSFSLRAGGRPRWAQSGKDRAAHSSDCTSAACPAPGLHLSLARCPTVESPVFLKTHLWPCSRLPLKGPCQLPEKQKADRDPETVLHTSSWSLHPVGTMLPSLGTAGVCRPSVFKTSQYIVWG